MKKFYFVLFVSLSLGFLVNSCKPDEPDEPDEQQPKDWKIPQEILDYFHFRTGSYWVFKNDKTSEVDTLIVIDRGIGSTIANSQGESYEIAKVKIKSSLDEFTYEYSSSMQGSSSCIKQGSKWPCHKIRCSKFKPGNVLGESISFILPFQKNYGGSADFSSEKSDITMIDTFENYKIDTFEFKSVVKVNITNSLVASRKNTNFYWAKNTGLIRKENLTDSENWTLIYFEIIE